MGKALGGFQTQVAIRLTGHLPLRTTDRKWRYISAAVAKEEAGFLWMEEYVRWHQNTVAQYIATQSLLDLCEGLERAPGEQVGMRWWEQEGIALERAREATAAVVEEERR